MFTIEEIDILIDGVDAWAAKSGSDRIMGTMIGMMFSKDKEEAIKVAEKEKAAAKNAEAAEKRRKEQAILLKAKLIQLKDSEEIKAAIEQQATT